MKYYVYILQSQKDQSYYVGYTQGIKQRLYDHNNGRGRYSSKKALWQLVYWEEYGTKTEAIIREQQIKKWKSKKLIEKLIQNTER